MKREYFGVGCLRALPKILSDNKAEQIFIITGKESFRLSGARNAIQPFLISSKSIRYFNDFSINPEIKDVEKGIKMLKESESDLVIAIGGGSTIDIAKLLNILAFQDSSVIDIITGRKEITNKGLPLIAIPTTSGSGSEATQFSVVYIDKTKYSLTHQFIRPDYSLIDPSLTYTMSPNLTAVCGFDALSQAVESFWSIKSNKISMQLSARAIKIISSSIITAVSTPSEESRYLMSMASNLAGKAINITTTTAPHAISYPITTYFGVPHGHAVALTVGKFFIINSNIEKDVALNETKGKKFLMKTMKQLFQLFDCSNAQECSKEWYKLMIAVGLEPDLRIFGINDQSDIKRIIDGVNIERLNNNPVRINESILNRLLVNLTSVSDGYR